MKNNIIGKYALFCIFIFSLFFCVSLLAENENESDKDKIAEKSLAFIMKEIDFSFLPEADNLQDNFENGIIGIIENHVITYRDVFEKIAGALVQTKQQFPESYKRKATILWRNTLQHILVKNLFLAAAEKENITIPPKLIEEKMEEDIKKMGGYESYRQLLQVNGIKETEYKETIKEDLIVYQYVNRVLQGVVPGKEEFAVDMFVSPSELKEYYYSHPEEFTVQSKYKIKQFNIYVKPEFKFLGIELGKALVDHIKMGADFDTIAQIYAFNPNDNYNESDGKKENSKKVNTEEVTLDELPKKIAEKFSKMKPGAVECIDSGKEVITIATLISITEPIKKEFNDVSELIENKLLAERKAKLMDKLEEKLKLEITYSPEDLFGK